jgi:hypothetical protein
MYNKNNAYIIQRVKQWNCEKQKKGQISNHEQKSSNKAATINRDPRPKDRKQYESRMRTESWHTVIKEEHEGESERRVSKAVLAKFGHQTNQKVKRHSSNAPHFSARIKDSRSRCCRNIRGLYNAMNGQKAHM